MLLTIYFLNCLHDDFKIPVQPALGFGTETAGPIRILIFALGTDISAEGFDIILEAAAFYRVDRLDNFIQVDLNAALTVSAQLALAVSAEINAVNTDSFPDRLLVGLVLDSWSPPLLGYFTTKGKNQ